MFGELKKSKMKKLLICVDRDGTIDYDKKQRPKYHLGRQRDWKSKVRFIESAIEGLKLLRKKLPNAKIYMISNQPGIAVKEFPLLTEKKSHEVFQYILKKLEKRGVNFNGYEFCGKASPSYVKRHTQYTFDKKLVGNFSCFKPNPGMIKDILKKEKLKRKDTKMYVLGDRSSDVKTAHKIGGFGILVPFIYQPEEKNKVKKLKNRKKYIARNFLGAARFIIKREKN